MIAPHESVPLAVRLGLFHVSVEPSGDGWIATCWSQKAGQWAICTPRDYEAAVDRAKGYSALDPRCVLSLPDGEGEREGRGAIHVHRREFGLEVMHESASGSSWATLRVYQPDETKRAVLFALDKLTEYHNAGAASRLGELVL